MSAMWGKFFWFCERGAARKENIRIKKNKIKVGVGGGGGGGGGEGKWMNELQQEEEEEEEAQEKGIIKKEADAPEPEIAEIGTKLA